MGAPGPQTIYEDQCERPYYNSAILTAVVVSVSCQLMGERESLNQELRS